MTKRPIFTSDARAKAMIEKGQIPFELEPVFPEGGSIDSKMVMRYPISMRISCYSFETEFLLATHILGQAVAILNSLPTDTYGAKAKLYVPISMRVLADHRFMQIVSSNQDFRSCATWFVLMGTPDSTCFFPEQIDLHELSRQYQKLGLKICVGDIYAEHIHLQIIQEGLESVIPSRVLESSPSMSNEMALLAQYAKAADIPLLTHQQMRVKLRPWSDKSKKDHTSSNLDTSNLQ